MTFLRRVADRWLQAPFRGSLIVATAWTALLVAGCSVDTRGFGGTDAGLSGGSGGGGGSGGMISGSGGTSAGGGGVTGSGGVPATGGVSGSGGAHASGGAPGSGGQVGSGGAAAGGHVGSGGAGGAAGGAGHGGSGTGGKGTGGRGGRGGRGGSGTAGAGGQGGETCDQLVEDYTKALTQARTCTVGATAQCQQSAPPMLSFCTECPQVSVNDNTPLTDIHSRWTAAGCAVVTVCPAIACVIPPPGTCTPTDSGFCQASGFAAN